LVTKASLLTVVGNKSLSDSQVKSKLEHLLRREEDDSYLLTNAEEFYSAPEPSQQFDL
jgi:hypothetical protein